MNNTFSSPFLGVFTNRFQDASPYALTPSHYVVLLTVLITSISILSSGRKTKIPLLNGPAWWQPTLMKKLEYLKSGMGTLAEGRAKSKGKAFRLITELGDMLILPNRYCNEIRNNLDLNFRQAIMEDFNSHLPGFETFALLGHKSQILQKVVRKQLTKHLNFVTAPLSAECTHATTVVFGNSKEWKEVTIKDPILELIARISSRVFLGDELCRNPPWLAVTKDYTVDSFKAAFKLESVPKFLRPLVAIFDPDCQRTRAGVKAARAMINEVIQRRQQRVAQAKANGEPVPVFDDALTWAEAESSGEKYDAAVFQLTLGFAAIHTTTDLLTKTIVLLAEKPHLIEPLRDEMMEVLRAEGWKKSALYNLKLLDSAIKEAQRVYPNAITQMRRKAMKDIHLSDGLVIPKGQKTVVDGWPLWSPETHQDPETYDIYRFKRMREQPGSESKAQLVSTHPDHPVFGHGYFACPGRFFASNEIKIALCHLLLKYDWKMTPGHSSKPLYHGDSMAANPDTRVMYKRRDEGIDLDALGTDG